MNEGARPVSWTRTAIALVAGWVFPGAGHAVLGRVRRGILFSVIVLGSFGLGLAHDGRLALRSPREPVLSALQVLANVGVGPLDVFARVSVYGEAAYALPAGGDPEVYERRLQILRDRARTALSIYGTAYLWTAGLMNLLLLLDVADIARGRKP